MRPLRWGAALLLAWALAAQAALIEGRVVAVADGDTLTVLDANGQQHRIRLLGIDAPEKNQPFGPAAQALLAAWVLERPVRIDYQKRDAYRRFLGTVWLADTDVNLQLVEHGAAWHYKRYQSDQIWLDQLRYAWAEQRARSQQKGLWAQPDPIAPWDFRAQARKKRE